MKSLCLAFQKLWPRLMFFATESKIDRVMDRTKTRNPQISFQGHKIKLTNCGYSNTIGGHSYQMYHNLEWMIQFLANIGWMIQSLINIPCLTRDLIIQSNHYFATSLSHLQSCRLIIPVQAALLISVRYFPPSTPPVRFCESCIIKFVIHWLITTELTFVWN